jgi:dipeptidyl aminopeptidase/acylaminoacyl peptidase
LKTLQKISPFDRLAGTTLIVLAVFTLSVIAYVNWLGLSVSLHTVNQRDQIGPYETLTFTFSQAVKANDVENELQLQPAISGKLTWLDDHTAHFIPAKPYFGTVRVRLARGQIGANGEWLRNDVSWALTVRQPQIVYMNYDEPKNELMAVSMEGGTPRQLTSTNGKIFDFDVAPSGDVVAYAVMNDQRGFDLWLVDRNGQNPHRLLDCGANRCSSPVWSPDGRLIAYSLEPAGLTAGTPNGAPRPWIVNTETGQNQPIFSDQQTIGYGILWSPDGNWVVTYDGIATQIHGVNLKTNQQVLLPSKLGRLGSWSPDSTSLIYADQTLGVNNILKTYLYRADFKTGEVGIFLGKDNDTVDYSYGDPIWSPKGDYIVFSLRPDPKQLDWQLWMIQPESLGGSTIKKGASFTYDFYQWDPWGIGLVIQQISLKKKYTPEIAVWYPQKGYHVIAAKGTFPRWLP